MEKSNPAKESLGNFLRNLWDLMILNGLWLLCCLPIVTVGPATCALYSVTLKLARGEATHPSTDFLRGIRSNFKAGLLMWLLAVVLLIVSCGDLYFAQLVSGAVQIVYLVIGIVMALICLTVFTYGFALQAMFENPLKTQLANAFKMAFVAPGKTVALWLIWMMPILAFLVLPPIAVRMLGFLYVILGASGPAYCASRILRNLFDRVNGSPLIRE